MGTYGIDRSGGAGGSGATQNYTPVTDVFDGDGTTVAFTLTVAPGSASALVARVSGVVQTPGVDFTVTSNVITFTTAPASGTDNIVVQNFGVAWSVATVAGSAITGLTSDLVTFTPSGSGLSESVQDALRTMGAVSLFRYIPVAERAGILEGTSTTDLLSYIEEALEDADYIVAPKGRYTISDQLVVTNKYIDFLGSEIVYSTSAPKGKFALVINATDNFGSPRYGAGNFLLSYAGTDVSSLANRVHGVNIGGTHPLCRNFTVKGLTGISWALGSGAEAHTGVTLPALEHSYYGTIGPVNVSSTSGWNGVIAGSNNANDIYTFSTFPYDGFSQTPPRDPNCIDELVIGGGSNNFFGLRLEGNPSNRKIKWLSTANANVIHGTVYTEVNANFDTSPFPRFEAEAGSSANRASIRHQYNGEKAISDLGVNKIYIVPAGSINGDQELPPTSSAPLVYNGDFNAGLTGWSNFSTNSTLSFTTGLFKGQSVRLDLVSGRPNLQHELVAGAGWSLDALRGQIVTAWAWVQTNISGVKVRLQGQTGNRGAPDDESIYLISTTARIASDATTVPLSIITEASGLTGYVKILEVGANIGHEAHATAPLSKAKDVRNTSAVGNVGTGEDNLMTTTLAAGYLSAAGKGIRVTAWGTKASTANAKTLRLYFGSVAILTHSLGTSAAGSWKITAEVLSTGTDAQDYNAFLIGTDTDAEIGTATQDDGAAIIVKCTGDATSNNDIVQEGLIVEHLS